MRATTDIAMILRRHKTMVMVRSAPYVVYCYYARMTYILFDAAMPRCYAYAARWRFDGVMLP